MYDLSVVLITCNNNQYIRETVESVLKQKSVCVELICVDDCSTDNTPEILSIYEKKHPNMRVIHHTQSRGPTAARYTGIQAATGRYVMFLNGNDTLIPGACAFLYKEMQQQNVELLGFGTVIQSDSQQPPSAEALAFLKKFLQVHCQYIPNHNEELLEQCFCEGRMSSTLWNKVYSRELITKAYSHYQGERLLPADDLLIFFMVLLYAESYGYTERVFYRYRVDNSIYTGNRLSAQKMERLAHEYKVYALLNQWLRPKERATHAKALRAIHDRAVTNIFYAFFHQAILSDCPQYLELILCHYPLKDFLDDLVDYVYIQQRCTPTQAIERLKNCKALVPTKRPVRTIGTFYFRMNNGGIERVISLLSPIWISMGYQVVVITEQPPCEQDYPLPEGVERAILPPINGDPKARLKNWRDIIEAYQIDVIVYHAWFSGDLMLDQIAVRSAGIPFLLHVHNTISQLFDITYRNPLLQEADYCLCNSILALSDVDCAWLSALGFSSHLVLNPLTYASETIEPAPLNGHEAVWVGRLSPEKQCYHAFAIAQLVHDAMPDFRLHVVGTAETTSEMDQIKRYLVQNQMTDYVILEGFHVDPAPFYRIASVHLCTSLFEGFPMIFGESKVFGLPLVTYELSNVQWIRQDQGMRVVPQGDIHNAAKQIIQILSNDELRRELGHQARVSAESLTVEKIAGLWADIFSTMFDGNTTDEPLYRHPALEVAIRLAMRKAWAGIENRSAETDSLRQKNNDLEQQNNCLRQQEKHLQAQNSAYAETVYNLTHSSIFIIGRIFTWPMRKLKKLLSKLL